MDGWFGTELKSKIYCGRREVKILMATIDEAASRKGRHQLLFHDAHGQAEEHTVPQVVNVDQVR